MLFQWILQQLKKQNDNAYVQRSGISALSNMCIGLDNELIGHLVDGRAVENIVSAMNNFPDDEFVQHVGCIALHNILYPELLSTQQRVIEAGGVKALVRAMSNHLDTKVIQMDACDALSTLKPAPGGKEAILMARGLSAIAAATEKYHGDEDVKISARRALDGLLE